MHSAPGRGYGLQPILESLNTWSEGQKNVDPVQRGLNSIYFPMGGGGEGQNC